MDAGYSMHALFIHQSLLSNPDWGLSFFSVIKKSKSMCRRTLCLSSGLSQVISHR